MKLFLFKDSTKLSDAFCEKLSRFISRNEITFIALSGGSTPKVIFQTLAEDFNNKIDWKKVHLFWGDERCVPPHHNESNYGMTKEFLLNKINIPQENVHRIKGENDPDYEAARYAEEINKYLPDANGLPQFDVMMLGLGEDGHTASIFPDQMELFSSEKICETAVHPSSKQKRITLTGKVINNSQKVFFLASGESKASVISKIINEKDDYLKYPAYYIRSFNSPVSWFLDMDAASELTNNV